MPDGRVATFEEKASDCYCTPDWVLDVVHGPAGLWDRIHLDPFWDPECNIDADECWDARIEDDAYSYAWPVSVGSGYGDDPAQIFANGPYSGKHPQMTAAKCADAYLRGAHVQNLCPAAPGSQYWGEHVWPLRPAVAWLGRVSFRAGRDIVNKAGEKIAAKGDVLHGNRTEIALVYLGPERQRFRCLWEVQGKAVTLG